MERKALGKGLGALIPLGEEKPGTGISEVPIKEIRPIRTSPGGPFPKRR